MRLAGPEGRGDQAPVRGRFHWQSFAADALLVSGGGLAANVINYAFHFVLSRSLGPDAYGSLAALLAIVMVVGVIGTSVGTAAMQRTARLWAAHRDDAIGEVSRKMTVLSLRVGCIVALATIVLAFPLSRYLHITSPLAWAALAVALFACVAAACVRGAIQGAHRFKVYAASLVVESAVKLALGIALVDAGLSVGGAMAGVAFGLIAGTAIASIPLASRRGSAVNGKPTPIGTDAWRLMAVYVASMALMYVDTVFAKHALSGVDAGEYTAAGLVARIIPFGVGLIAPLIAPKAVAARHADRGALGRLLVVTFGFAAAATILVLAVMESIPGPLIGVTFGAAFAPAATLLRVYAVDASLIALGQLGAAYLAAVGEYGVAKWLAFSLGAQIVAMALFGDAAVRLLVIAIAGNALVLPPIVALIVRSTRESPQAPIPRRAEAHSSQPEHA